MNIDFVSLFKENWIFTLIAVLLVLFIVGCLMRAAFKLAFTLFIIGVILVTVFGYSTKDVIKMGKDATRTASVLFQNTVEPVLKNELKDAKYTVNKDGTYVIKTQNVKIEGKKGEKQATVYFKNQSFKIDIEKYAALIQQSVKDFKTS